MWSSKSLVMAAAVLLAGAGCALAKVPAKRVLPHLAALARPHVSAPAKHLQAARPAKVIARFPAARAVARRPDFVHRPAARRQLMARFRTLPAAAFRSPVKSPVMPAQAPRTQLASLTPPAGPPLPVTGQPVLLAQTSDWSAFRAVVTGGLTCFAATRPKDSEPRRDDRGPAGLYVTTFVAAGIKQELTIRLGLPASAGDQVTASVNGRDFALQAADGLAYLGSDKAQANLLEAMRAGHTLVLRTAAKGSAGPVVRDAYSLLGFNDALSATEAACSQTLTSH